ncbi:MAG: energy-coupling factor ABC transporter substrate-binding protein [Methanomicrobiales archaeon]|nr:energy-coupling factor ABC transporter substrate-binding protein [Methanomicrobiales archaeon]
MRYATEILVGAILLASIAALAVVMGSGEHSWEGSDSQAAAAVQQITGGYEPWVQPLWTPPGREMETLLFCLPAAGGALVIGFFFGYYARGRHRP